MDLHRQMATRTHGSLADSGGVCQQAASAFSSLRRHLRSYWPEWCAVSFFAALVGSAIPYHEPTADVAQAWQLARNLSLPSLFQTYIRYEGSPGLWHLLLWMLIRVHVSYTGLQWVCGAIAVGATALLVFKSPLPRYLKLVLPFTYFLLFQYAVVARSYVLAPLLLYLVALCWRKSPLMLALLLGLLANVALHAAAISGGLAIVYLLEQARNGGAKSPCRRRQLLRYAFILIGFWAFAIWTAWPPRDLSNYLSFRLHASWFLYFVRVLWSIVLPVSEHWLLSIFFWIAIVICLRVRRSLLYLLPVLFLAVFSGAVASEWWHLGLMVPLVICLLWITWPTQEDKVSWGEAAGRIALIAMASLHILWSAYALEFDHYNAYSPDLAESVFLRPFVMRSATIAVTYLDTPSFPVGAFFSVGVMPYFDHGIYINEPGSFWSWSNQNPTEERFKQVLPSHPALVIVELHGTHPDDPLLAQHPKIQMLQQAGYSPTNVFCGVMPEGFLLRGNNCDLIFQRPNSPREPPANKASADIVAR
jgi:hypothetical protein